MTTEKATDLAKTDDFALNALRPKGEENAIFFNKDLFAQAQRAAELLSKSQIIPDQYRNKMPDCFIALASANRLNVDVFAFMQSSYVVHGRPGIEAKLLIALVNSRGPFDGPIQWKMEGEGNDRQCTAYARHAKTKELCETTVTWAMVVAEGWNIDSTTRQGKVIKSKWNTLPDLMFRYRSATFLARLYCPEVILGITTVDELQDIQMTQTPSGIYEREEQKDQPDIDEQFHKIFLFHKGKATVGGITKGIALLAKKFNMTEEEIKKNALEDPEGFEKEVKKITKKVSEKPSDESKPETDTSPSEEEQPTGSQKSQDSEKIEVPPNEFPEPPIDTALRTAKEEKEKLQNPESKPGQVADLKAYLDSCEDKNAALAQIKKEYFGGLCREDRSELMIYYKKLQ